MRLVAHLSGQKSSSSTTSTKEPFSREAKSQPAVTTTGGRPFGPFGAHRAKRTCVRRVSGEEVGGGDWWRR